VRNHDAPLVAFSRKAAQAEAAIKEFLYQRMYRHARVVRVMRDAEAVVRDLFARYHAVPDDLPADWAHGRATTARRSGRGGSAISSPA